jgi:hypothetical protein
MRDWINVAKTKTARSEWSGRFSVTMDRTPSKIVRFRLASIGRILFSGTSDLAIEIVACSRMFSLSAALERPRLAHKGIVAVSCEDDILLQSRARRGSSPRDLFGDRKNFRIRSNELLDARKTSCAQSVGSARRAPDHRSVRVFKIRTTELLKMKKPCMTNRLSKGCCEPICASMMMRPKFWWPVAHVLCIYTPSVQEHA